MIDAKDYKPGDIIVKTVDDTVVVEGKIEQKEGNTIKTQVFTRRFMLPPTVNMNAVSSALSRDGVLTIYAPKLVGAADTLTCVTLLTCHDISCLISYLRIYQYIICFVVHSAWHKRVIIIILRVSSSNDFLPLCGCRSRHYTNPECLLFWLAPRGRAH